MWVRGALLGSRGAWLCVGSTLFLFLGLPTGTPAVLRAARDPQPHLIKEIERVLGLDKSLPTQFWDYVKGVFLHFNFGFSYYSQQSVTALIKERLPATISLAVGAGIIWVLAG